MLALASLDATCALPAKVQASSSLLLQRPNLRGGAGPGGAGPGGATPASTGPVTALGPFAQRQNSGDLAHRTGIDSESLYIVLIERVILLHALTFQNSAVSSDELLHRGGSSQVYSFCPALHHF